MALSETARLLASLELKDQFTPTVNKALASTTKLETRLGKVGTIASKGFRTIGTNIRNLLTGPAGIIGLGAGVFALTNFISGSVNKAREFGEAVFRVRAIIGGTTQDVSRLVDVLGDYGIESEAIVRIGGMFEKNIGNIAKSTKAAAKFQAEYGFSILDAAGNAKDFNTVLLEAADIFTSKTIPQSQKAALLAKLYGRNWQELVPILSKGRAELEKTLDRGITLTEDQAKAMERARKSGIRWEDAIGDLQTMIGIELLPVLTKFANRATRFIQEHGDEIRQFFRDAAKFAEGMGRAIRDQVLPAIQRIGDFWAGIPDDLKKILIGGFVVNKLSGGAITGIFSELAKGLIKGVLGITAGVVNIKAATVTGVPGTGTGTAGGKGTSAARAVGTGIAGIVAVVGFGELIATAQDVSAAVKDQKQAVTSQLQAFLATNPTKAQIDAVIAAQERIPESLDPIQRGIFELNVEGVKTKWEEGLAALKAARESTDRVNATTGKAADDIVVGVKKSTAQNIAHLNRVVAGVNAGKQATTATRAAVQATSARQIASLHGVSRNIDQVESAINRKKLQVRVNQNQRQSLTAIATANSTGAKASGGKDDTVIRRTDSQLQNIDRYLATGAVGVASRPTPAIFGEAGREAFAILRNPRSGSIGGGPPIVKVTVNIDPRRVTKKQTSSGIYKTFVAT